MKKIIPFNQWYYKEEFRESDAGDSSLEGMTAVTVPHANKEIPFNYFDEGCYQFVSCYKKQFSWKPAEGQRVFIRCGAIANSGEVKTGLPSKWIQRSGRIYLPLDTWWIIWVMAASTGKWS